MEKLAELLKDKAFAAELMKQATAEDAQKFIAAKGVEVSLEDLQSIRAEILKQEQTGEELSDDQLGASRTNRSKKFYGMQMRASVCIPHFTCAR